MDHLYINYQLDKDATLPTKSHDTDAGWDLYANEDAILNPTERILIDTGLHIDIPGGWCAFLKGRSGLSAKNGVNILGGVIDAHYTGPIKICVHYTQKPVYKLNYNPGNMLDWSLKEMPEPLHIKKGDRIAQMLFHRVPEVTFIGGELHGGDRSEKGFGSSGR